MPKNNHTGKIGGQPEWGEDYFIESAELQRQYKEDRFIFRGKIIMALMFILTIGILIITDGGI